MRLCALVLCVMVLTGCLTPNTGKEISEDVTAVAVLDQQTGPPVAATGAGSANYIGDEALKALAQTRSKSAGVNADVWAKFTSKNPATLALWGMGIILCVIAFGFLWSKIKDNFVGVGISKANEALKRRVDTLMATKAEVTDPTVMAHIDRHINEVLTAANGVMANK